MNNTYTKAVMLVIYAITILSLLVEIPGGSILRTIIFVMLLAHVVEVVVCQKQIRLYQGSLVDSIALTLVFGLFHWKPLADKAARDANA